MTYLTDKDHCVTSFVHDVGFRREHFPSWRLLGRDGEKVREVESGCGKQGRKQIGFHIYLSSF